MFEVSKYDELKRALLHNGDEIHVINKKLRRKYWKGSRSTDIFIMQCWSMIQSLAANIFNYQAENAPSWLFKADDLPTWMLANTDLK
jgi:hypothetical protein